MLHVCIFRSVAPTQSKGRTNSFTLKVSPFNLNENQIANCKHFHKQTVVNISVPFVLLKMFLVYQDENIKGFLKDETNSNQIKANFFQDASKEELKKYRPISSS